MLNNNTTNGNGNNRDTGTYTSLRSIRPTGGLTFLREFIAEPNVVGALAPSSKPLAHALIEPFLNRTEPARILEVGAGTGAVTRHLAPAIGTEDTIAICEIQPRLVSVLEESVLTLPQFQQARSEGRLTVHACAVQEIEAQQPFDYVICGLPFTAFRPQDIREILRAMRRLLRPGGIFSYFEYVALRRLRTALCTGEKRLRMKQVSAVMECNIRRFETRRTMVVRNFPPAYARHWKFIDQ